MGLYLFLLQSSWQGGGLRGCEAQPGGVPGGVRGEVGVQSGGPCGGGLGAALDEILGLVAIVSGEAVSV